jgi:hypothetical protein
MEETAGRAFAHDHEAEVKSFVPPIAEKVEMCGGVTGNPSHVVWHRHLLKLGVRAATMGHCGLCAFG